MEPNVIAVADVAKEKGCSRQAIYYAIERGDLTAVKIGRMTVVLKDDWYRDYTPRRIDLKEKDPR